MNTIDAVAVSGSLGVPSRSSQLAQAVLRSIGQRTLARTFLVEIAQVGMLLGHGLERAFLPAPARAALELVERADVLVIATPVYRGSYPGLFKHFFDLVDRHALVDVPIVLAANGGSTRHAMMIEHALRPLFSCFRAHAVPTAIFATADDFSAPEQPTSELAQRIDLAARQAVSLLHMRSEKGAGLPSSAPEPPFDSQTRLT